MVEQVLLLLQALFLVLLYLFVWRVVRTASRDLRLPQESFFLAPPQAHGGGAPEPSLRLVVESSPSIQPGTTFQIGTAPLTVGRSTECSVALAADDYASARHARIEPLRDGVWIADLESTNGTYVNGEQVNGRLRLFEGDVVRIGETDLRVAR